MKRYIEYLREKFYTRIGEREIFINPTSSEWNDIVKSSKFNSIKLLLKKDNSLYGFESNIEHGDMADKLGISLDKDLISLYVENQDKVLHIYKTNFTKYAIDKDKEMLKVLKRVKKKLPIVIWNKVERIIIQVIKGMGWNNKLMLDPKTFEEIGRV